MDIFDASELGYLDLVKKFAEVNKNILNCKGAFGRTPLHLAIICGHENVS